MFTQLCFINYIYRKKYHKKAKSINLFVSGTYNKIILSLK